MRIEVPRSSRMTTGEQDITVAAARERLRTIGMTAARGANQPDQAEVFAALEEMESLCGQRPTDEGEVTRGFVPIGQVIQDNADMLLRRGLRVEERQ